MGQPNIRGFWKGSISAELPQAPPARAGYAAAAPLRQHAARGTPVQRREDRSGGGTATDRSSASSTRAYVHTLAAIRPDEGRTVLASLRSPRPITPALRRPAHSNRAMQQRCAPSPHAAPARTPHAAAAPPLHRHPLGLALEACSAAAAAHGARSRLPRDARTSAQAPAGAPAGTADSALAPAPHSSATSASSAGTQRRPLHLGRAMAPRSAAAEARRLCSAPASPPSLPERCCKGVTILNAVDYSLYRTCCRGGAFPVTVGGAPAVVFWA